MSAAADQPAARMESGFLLARARLSGTHRGSTPLEKRLVIVLLVLRFR
jgi:hypothetical protein